MQPNNQNPYQQGQNQPPPNTPAQVTGYTGANVPDYLHLDPIVQPDTSSKKKIMIFAAIVIVILVIGIGLAVYLFSQQNASERLFYRSLENAMKTDFVKKKYIIGATNPTMKLTMDVETDFSNPAAPKSLIHQEYSLEYTGAAKKTVKGSEVAWNDGTYYSFIDTATNAKNPSIQSSVWYEHTDTRGSSSDSDTVSLTDVDKRQDINSSHGLIIQGKLNDSQRSTLLGYINQRGIYSIDSTETQIDTTKYIIRVDYQALNDLNKELSKLLESDRTYSTLRPLSGGSEQISLFVDNKTERIEKVLYTAKNIQSDSDFTRSISFDYPAQVAIEKPNDFKKAAK